jgi:hypothetical protein
VLKLLKLSIIEIVEFIGIVEIVDIIKNNQILIRIEKLKKKQKKVLGGWMGGWVESNALL